MSEHSRHVFLDVRGSKFLLSGVSDLKVLSSKLTLDGFLFDQFDFMNVEDFLRKQGIYEVEGSERAFSLFSVLKERLSEIRRIKMIRTGETNAFMKTEPYADQWGAIRFLLSRQFVGNWDTMGAGKTFVSIYAFSELFKEGLVSDALVFCVNSAKAMWVEEVKKHSLFSVKKVGNGTHAVVNDVKDFNEEGFLIVHYDALTEPKVVEKILSKRFDCVVIDEAHKIKNLKAKRTKSVLHIVKNVQRKTLLDVEKAKKFGLKIFNERMPFVWCLTGTPVAERPSDAYTILKLLYDSEFDISLRRFEEFFCVFKELQLRNRGIKIKKVIGFRNEDHLKRIFEPVSIMRRAHELTGLPEKVRIDRFLEMSEAQWEVYKKVREGVVQRILSLGEKRVKVSRLSNIFVGLWEVLSHPAILGFDAPSVKHEAVIEMAEESVEPLLVWIIFRKGAEMLLESLKKEGFAAEIIYGGVSEKDIEKIRDMIADGKIKVLICSIKKMGTSVDFLKIFRKAIYLDIPVSLIEYVQSEDRLVRRGVEEKAMFFRLVVKNSLDEYICELLNKKEKLVGELAGGVDDIDVDVEEVLNRI